MANESTQKTITVALILCIVCSVIVSTAAVLLKPAQVANKAKDFKINILKAGGLYDQVASGKSVDEVFAQVTPKLVDLAAGQYTQAVAIDSYDQRKAAKDPALSIALNPEDDIAKIGSQAKYAKIYLVENDQGIEKMILPIKGYGLWSTLYGFISLESDLNTVSGFAFYEHAETPGLGGEVDNPKWKALWPGKKVYGENDDLKIAVIKGKVSPGATDAQHKVDGLSGASLTTRGVHNLVQFWMGDMGYKKFISNLKNGGA